MTAARRRAFFGGLALAAAAVTIGGTPAVAASHGSREAFVFVVDGVSFPDLLPLPGGVALLSGGASLRDLLREWVPGAAPVRVVSLGSIEASPQPGHPDEPVVDGDALLAAWERIRANLRDSSAEEVLVVIATGVAPRTQPSSLTPVALGVGDPATLLPGPAGPVLIPGRRLRSLTSDSTRRIGVVTSGDVVATVLAFVGEPVPADLPGSAIRTTDEPWPFALNERYLAQRRMYVPIGVAAGLYVTFAGLAGVAALAFRRRVRSCIPTVAGWAAISVAPLGVALLAAGHLPRLSYATVVPFTVAVTTLGTLAVVPLARRDVLLAPAALGWAVLAYFAVEALLGWTAALTPFLGGSELDGGRFYGLPNVFIGLLAGSALYASARLRPAAGFALLVFVALFAGLPFCGANLGGAVTIFAAAGLWLPLRMRGRLGPREVGFAALVVLGGLVLVLLAHRFLAPVPTHVTRFEETTGRSLSGIVRTIGDRLLVGWRLILRNPFALVPVLGVPATLAAVLRPPRPVREAFERLPVWRDVILVTILSSAVAYVANDSGAAACGLGFGLGLGGLLYVSLLAGTGKMGAA